MAAVDVRRDASAVLDRMRAECQVRLGAGRSQDATEDRPAVVHAAGKGRRATCVGSEGKRIKKGSPGAARGDEG